MSVGNIPHKDKKNPHTSSSTDELSVEALKKRVAELEAQYKEVQDKYLRTLAESDNARKRHIKEKEDVRFGAFETAFRAIIQIFDHFSMAIASARQHVPDNILKGLEMTLNQFHAQLQSLAIEPIDPQQGQNFDPNLQEAVSYEYNGTVPADQVIETLAVGYRWNQRLLRPAKVKVSKGKEPPVNSPKVKPN